MPDPTMRHVARSVPTAAYTDGYEQIRRHAVDHAQGDSRSGWVIIVRSGVVSWLDAFADAPVMPPVAKIPGHPYPASASCPSRINIMVAMIQANVQASMEQQSS